jgi:serine/threonine-protein kinase ATR
MSSRRIIVSIDFGTTYSGVAWADTTRVSRLVCPCTSRHSTNLHQPDVQHVVTSWPAVGSSKSSPKVPTELRKVANGWQWGFQIPESAKRSKYFKLFVCLLWSFQSLGLISNPCRKLDDTGQITKDGESAQDLTKVYLSCLHAHFVTILEARLSPSVVRSTPMDFVVTVPAIWSPAAKQATERAAAMAGFCGHQRIMLISEPVCSVSGMRLQS